MSRFKMSNLLFGLELDAQEISVYTYLCSIHSNRATLLGDCVKVKQATIAQKCGIKSVQTVAKIVKRLTDKGLIESLVRSVKSNGHLSTISYIVKKLSMFDGFFFVDRHVFGQLVPRQMKVYLFICKSFSNVLNECWNSYKDIAEQINMKRELVIRTVNELTELGLIIRRRCRSRENKRVYVDNHYSVVIFIRHRKICKKIRLHLSQRHSLYAHNGAHIIHCHYNSMKIDGCQGKHIHSGNIFFKRGSP